MEDPLAEAILSSEFKEGDILIAEMNKDKDGLVFSTKKKRRKKPEPADEGDT